MSNLSPEKEKRRKRLKKLQHPGLSSTNDSEQDASPSSVTKSSKSTPKHATKEEGVNSPNTAEASKEKKHHHSSHHHHHHSSKHKSPSSPTIKKKPSETKKRYDDDDEEDKPKADTSLPLSTCLLYALPTFPVAIFATIFALSVLPYYETLGVSLTQVAFFTAFSRSWDCLTDPFMGHLTDSTITSLGRRRPFLFIGAPFYAFFTVMILSPGYLFPSMANNEAIGWWFGLFFVLYYFSDTFTHIPYNALGPELSSSTHDRNRLYFIQFVVIVAGVITGAVAPTAIGIIVMAAYPKTYSVTAVQVAGGYNSTGGFLVSESDATAIVANHAQSFGFFATASCFAVFYLITMYLLATLIREKPLTETQRKKTALLPSINSTLKNHAFRVLMAGWVLDSIAGAISGAVLPFYIYYYLEPRTSGIGGLNDNEWLAILALSLYAMGFVGAPFWMLLSEQVGKRKAWLIFNIVGTLSKIGTFFVHKGEAAKSLIFCAISGLELGGGFLNSGIMSDVISYDEFLTGERREGQFSMLVSFIPKIVSIPGSTIPLAIIAATGFINPINGVIQEQSEFTSNTIIILYAGLPMLCNFISFFIKLRYPILDETFMEKYTEGIILHQKNLPATDPISNQLIKPPVRNLLSDEHDQIQRLGHFSRKSIRQLKDNNHDATFLISSTRLRIVGGFLSFVLFVVGVAEFYPLLELDSLGWIPSLCEILAGGSLTLMIFFYLQYCSACEMVKVGVRPDVVQAYLDSFDPISDHSRGTIGSIDEQGVTMKNPLEAAKVEIIRRVSNNPLGWRGISKSKAETEMELVEMTKPKMATNYDSHA